MCWLVRAGGAWFDLSDGLASGIVWFVIIVSPISWFAEGGRKTRKRAESERAVRQPM